MKIEDIPDFRKEIQGELLKDENLFITLLENLGTGVALIDSKGHFLLYNKKFLQLFGLSEESSIKNVNDQNWSEWQVFNENLEILHVDEHPVRKAAITGKRVNNQLAAVKLPSGDAITWMLISAEPIFDKQGLIEKTICTYVDITERKEADVALQRSEQRYRQLFNSMSEIFILIDIVVDKDGNTTGYKILDVNPAFEKAMGKSIEQLINIRMEELFPGIKEKWLEIYDKVFRTGEPVRFNSHAARIDKDFEFSSWKTPENNIAVIISDITDRIKTERILRENETRLKELNSTKDKLFSIISHDLKSPFTSIIGFSDLLVENFDRKDRKTLEEYAKIIQQSSWKAMDLLTNLIEWSGVQTGRMKFDPVQTDIVPVIEKIRELMEEMALHKDIKISTTVPPYLLVNADLRMVETILRNLLSNAIKFTESGGKVDISCSRYNNEARITVSDTGKGIDEEKTNKIFTTDEGFSTPGTNGEKGTGLGLLICKEFVQKHGGRIWAETIPEGGSRFTFTIRQNVSV